MNTRFNHVVIGTLVGFGLLISAALLQAQPAFRQDRILVKPSGGNIEALHTQLGTRVLRSFPRIGNIQVVELPQGLVVADAIAEFVNSGLVEYAEPDHILQATQTHPNDPSYVDGTLWGLHNTGQDGGSADADIDAPEAWDHATTANNVIVAVIDSGVRYTHEDLAANMWVNADEIAGNGIDSSQPRMKVMREQAPYPGCSPCMRTLNGTA